MNVTCEETKTNFYILIYFEKKESESFGHFWIDLEKLGSKGALTSRKSSVNVSNNSRNVENWMLNRQIDATNQNIWFISTSEVEQKLI